MNEKKVTETEEQIREKLKKNFEKLANSSIFDEGKKKMKEYELKVRCKKKLANLKKHIKSRRRRKRIYKEILGNDR